MTRVPIAPAGWPPWSILLLIVPILTVPAVSVGPSRGLAFVFAVVAVLLGRSLLASRFLQYADVGMMGHLHVE